MSFKVCNYVLAVLMVFISLSSYSQIRVGPPSGSLDGSSSLEVESGPYSSGSPYRGLLSPTMTTIQRDQIVNPAKGLIVFNTTTNQIEVNTGTSSSPTWTAGGALTISGNNVWSLNGNANTTNNNFLGTTDNLPLNFRVNNSRAGWVDPVNFNVAFGSPTLNSGATGQGNTAYGSGTLQSQNSNAGFNSAIGYRSLRANTSGIANNALGAFTLENNTSGHDNTAAGNSALRQNTTGNYNTAVGTGALPLNTSGYENTSIGGNSLANNTTGYSNVAVGQDAMVYNVTNHDNVAIGSSALIKSTSDANTSVGALSMMNTTTGGYNTALGDLAGQNNTVGSYNVFIGLNAGPNNKSLSSNNTFVGVNAGTTNSNVATVNNATSIGYNSPIFGDNTVVLGNAGITSLRCNVTTITALSDSRVKENVRSNVAGLSFINKLNPVTYYKNKRKEADLLGYSVNNIEEDHVLHSGFIAQQVAEAAKSVGYNFEGVRFEENKYYTLGYTLFVVPLVQAVKDLNSKIDLLESRIRMLERNSYTQAKYKSNKVKDTSVTFQKKIRGK